jgi:hypothetical protein
VSLQARQLRNVNGIVGTGSIDAARRVCGDAKPSAYTLLASVATGVPLLVAG